MLRLDNRLIILAEMIEAAELVRTLEHLKAAVLARRRIERDIDAHHVRREAAVVVPISEVLMPLPRAALIRLFHGHLVDVEVDRLADGVLCEVDHPLVAREKAILVVAGSGPHFQEGGVAFPIGLRHDRAAALLLLELLARASAEPVDFFRAEKTFAEDVTVESVATRLLRGH